MRPASPAHDLIPAAQALMGWGRLILYNPTSISQSLPSLMAQGLYSTVKQFVAHNTRTSSATRTLIFL